MAFDQLIFTSEPATYQCVNCGAEVGTEPNHMHDKFGNIITYHSPASRYWLSKGHPSMSQGVLCGADCSLAFTLGKPPGFTLRKS